MGRSRVDDVLVALLGTDAARPIDGDALLGRLGGRSGSPDPSKVLVTLVGLEEAGDVGVSRQGGYRFWLTPQGTQRAYDRGDGETVEAIVVMSDLAGFTSFTESAGDEAARDVACVLTRVANDAFGPVGGRVVKSLGDGILGWLPPEADPIGPLGEVRRGMSGVRGRQWVTHSAAHRGRPIVQGGDLFGADVNLVARLCAMAGPDEVLVTAADDDRDAEWLEVRGMGQSVPVTRVSLAQEERS